MIYRWRSLYSDHWQMMVNMIEENYANVNNCDAFLVLGLNCFFSCTQLKEQFNTERLITYQLEPLVDQHWWKPELILKNLEGADEVWDYDLENIAFLKQHGINAKYKPPIYAQSLKTVQNVENPDIDILFYGTLTERRARFLSTFLTGSIISDEVQNIWLNSKFVYLNNTFGKQLEEYIARSKIVLNLNPYEGECRQQQTRIFHNLINNKCVLSEKNRFNYYGDMIVEFENNDTQNMFEKIVYLLKDDNWKQYANDNYKTFCRNQLKDNT